VRARVSNAVYGQTSLVTFIFWHDKKKKNSAILLPFLMYRTADSKTVLEQLVGIYTAALWLHQHMQYRWQPPSCAGFQREPVCVCHMMQTKDVCDWGRHGTQRSTDPKLGKQWCFE